MDDIDIPILVHICKHAIVWWAINEILFYYRQHNEITSQFINNL